MQGRGVRNMDCFDFQVNAGETDIDCGGTSCWRRCDVGQRCEDGSDCISGACEANVCMGSRMLGGVIKAGSGASAVSVDEASQAAAITTISLFVLVVFACLLIAKCSDAIVKRQRRRSISEDSVGLPLTSIDAEDI